MSGHQGPSVLDASAVLALLQEEPGADEVEAALDAALMSCVNLSEVLQKAEQHEADVEGLEYDLQALGVEFRPFDLSASRSAAALWRQGSGLSLGDRACLALAAEVDGVALTTDRTWTRAARSVRVRVVR